MDLRAKWAQFIMQRHGHLDFWRLSPKWKLQVCVETAEMIWGDVLTMRDWREADETLGRLIRESVAPGLAYQAHLTSAPDGILQAIAGMATYHMQECWESSDYEACTCNWKGRRQAIYDALKTAIEAHAAVQDA